MATIKSYTDLEQSKKLAEILPLESADMRYEYSSREREDTQEPMNGFHTSSFNWFKESDSFIYFPCWSLAALLAVLPNENMLVKTTDGKYYCLSKDIITNHYDNPIDACYEMILKLHELNLL